MRPLEGIRVLEVAMYGFVPSAGAVLTEWGADVIKVEHAVTGDPQRGLRQTGMLRVTQQLRFAHAHHFNTGLLHEPHKLRSSVFKGLQRSGRKRLRRHKVRPQ